MIKLCNSKIICTLFILSTVLFTACSTNTQNNQAKVHPADSFKIKNDELMQDKRINFRRKPITKPSIDDEQNKPKPLQTNVQPTTDKQQNNHNPSVKKVVYLTFDDGPSEDITPQIINVLQKYNIKATFFVIGSYAEKHPELVKLELKDGFNVGNHTYSHDCDYIYKSPENLQSDFRKNENLLKSIVPGYNSKLVRFPGGSRQRNREFVKIVKNAGYNIVDWNCLSKDAENPNYTVNDLVKNVKNTSRGKNSLIVLMHDASGRMNTVQSLPIIIEYFQSQGYKFELLI